jgi:hypothetical protein
MYGFKDICQTGGGIDDVFVQRNIEGGAKGMFLYREDDFFP